jgi:two-component system NtrC family sensor kinase
MSPKVLFVDDDKSNLLVCEAVCGDEFPVLTAQGGAEALEIMQRHEVGVVVSDQRMPLMSGVELLERIRKAYPDVVRLLVTAYADVQAAIDAINHGQVRRYLRKPWEPEELKAEIRDALERFSTRQRLAELERRFVQTERVYALGIVAAGIGHELRNPISWISSNTEHALEELKEIEEELARLGHDGLRGKVEEVRAALLDASSGAERVTEIVSGIQSSLAGPAGDDERVDVEEVVRLALRMVEAQLNRTARIELDVRGPSSVTGSRTRVSQIAVNLLVNAGHAVAGLPSDRARIAVRIWSREGWAFLEVADAGSGVPEEQRERIFDPFFTTKPGVGTGLGLAISRKIAVEMGGVLSVGSDERLGGALFRLRLPARTI